MKNFSIKTFLLVLILLLTVSIPGMTKTIRSNDGRVYYTTPDTWYMSKSNSSSSTIDVLTVALDDTTRVTFNRSSYAFNVKRFRDISYDQKCKIRDTLIRHFYNDVKSQGYDFNIAKSDIYDDGIFIVYHVFKYGKKYLAIETFSVKNYYGYVYCLEANEYTWEEATKVFKSLTIEGMLYSSWIEMN